MYTATVTQKGQVTLPKKLRDKLKIKAYHKVTIKEGKNHLKIYPSADILDFAGKFKAPTGMTALKAREYMENHYERA